MTTIVYECIGTDGETLQTSSYPEAQKFSEQHGGSVKQIQDKHFSDSEPFTKRGYRKPGSRT